MTYIRKTLKKGQLTLNQKKILDVTCGGKTIWFNKNHPNALYLDIRKEKKGFIKKRPHFEINPDTIADFRKLPFPDKSFKLVVFDPPHLMNLRENSWPCKKYGSLKSETWQRDLKKGFKECWRVLEDEGILILKWSCSKENRADRDIPLKKLLRVLPETPLFGHTGHKVNAIWLCFMKIRK